MTNALKVSDYYMTPDLALASALSLWFPIEAIDKTNPQKAVFIFNREPGLEEAIESYWKKELKVEPQSYFAQIKSVKTRLYSEF